MRDCGRCGDECEGYPIFINNSIVSFSMYKVEKEYIEENYNGNVCRDCRGEIRKEIFDLKDESEEEME